MKFVDLLKILPQLDATENNWTTSLPAFLKSESTNNLNFRLSEMIYNFLYRMSANCR